MLPERDVADREHRVEDLRAARPGRRRPSDGVVAGRVGRDPGEQRRLGEVQVVRALVEVDARRLLDTLRAVDEVYSVKGTFRPSVRVFVTYMFFTYCCVIVEPPSTTALWRMSAQSARAMPRTSTPWCSQKRRSSIATIASFIRSLISSESTSTRLSDPRRTASTLVPSFA
jgi:hypothetical protein